MGRLLGVRILTLDTTVVLVPADVSGSSSAPHHVPPHPSARSSAVPSTRSDPAGQGLAKAMQSINEGAEILAAARRNGSSPP